MSNFIIKESFDLSGIKEELTGIEAALKGASKELKEFSDEISKTFFGLNKLKNEPNPFQNIYNNISSSVVELSKFLNLLKLLDDTSKFLVGKDTLGFLRDFGFVKQVIPDSAAKASSEKTILMAAAVQSSFASVEKSILSAGVTAETSLGKASGFTRAFSEETVLMAATGQSSFSIVEKNIVSAGAATEGSLSRVGGFAKALTGLAAVAGATYLAYKTNFGGIGDIFRDFGQFLNDEFGQSFQGFWMGMGDTLVGFLGFMDETVSTFFGMIDHISKAMRAAADKDWNWFKAEAENAARDAKALLTNLFNPNSASDLVQNARREAAYKKFFPGKTTEETKTTKSKREEKLKTYPDIPLPDTNKEEKTKLDLLKEQLFARMSILKTQEKEAQNASKLSQQPKEVVKTRRWGGIADAMGISQQMFFDWLQSAAGETIFDSFVRRKGLNQAKWDELRATAKTTNKQWFERVFKELEIEGKTFQEKYDVLWKWLETPGGLMQHHKDAQDMGMDLDQYLDWLSDVMADGRQRIDHEAEKIGLSRDAFEKRMKAPYEIKSADPDIYSQLAALKGMTRDGVHEWINEFVDVQTPAQIDAVEAVAQKFSQKRLDELYKLQAAAQEYLNTVVGKGAEKDARAFVGQLADLIVEERGQQIDNDLKAKKEQEEAQSKRIEAVSAKAKKTAEEAADFAKKLREENEADEEEFAFETPTSIESLSSFEKKMTGIRSQIQAYKSSLIDTNAEIAQLEDAAVSKAGISNNQQNLLNELLDDRLRLMTTIGRATEEADRSEDLRRRQESAVFYRDMLEEIRQGVDKTQAFENALTSSKEALAAFAEMAKKGEVNLFDMAGKFGLNEEAVNGMALSFGKSTITLREFMGTMGLTNKQIDLLLTKAKVSQAGNDLGKKLGKVKEAVEDAREQAEKAEAEAKKAEAEAKAFFDSVVQTAFGAVGLISNAFKTLGGESGQIFGEVLNGLVGIGQGIVAGTPIGAIQALGAAFDMLTGFIGRSQQVMIDMRNELLNLNGVMNQTEQNSLLRQLFDAQASQAPASVIGGIKKGISLNQAKGALEASKETFMKSDFGQKYGGHMVSLRVMTGNSPDADFGSAPPYEEILKEMAQRQGLKTPEELVDFLKNRSNLLDPLYESLGFHDKTGVSITSNVADELKLVTGLITGMNSVNAARLAYREGINADEDETEKTVKTLDENVSADGLRIELAQAQQTQDKLDDIEKQGAINRADINKKYDDQTTEAKRLNDTKQVDQIKKNREAELKIQTRSEAEQMASAKQTTANENATFNYEKRQRRIDAMEDGLEKERDALDNEKTKERAELDASLDYEKELNGDKTEKYKDFLDKKIALESKYTKLSENLTDKAGEEAKAKFDKTLADEEKKLKEKAENLKKARSSLYEDSKKTIQAQIDAEQLKIDKIDEQNKGLQKQIQIKQDLLKQDEEAFDKVDVSEFAAAVRGVDYDAQIRQALDDFHNPADVETGTYSVKSLQESATERLGLLKLRNENKFKLEQYNSGNPEDNLREYLLEKKRIAALQARFAEEAQKQGSYTYTDADGNVITDELTPKDYAELERLKAEAYSEYQDAHKQALRSKTEEEVALIGKSVEANNLLSESYKTNLEGYQKNLGDINKALAADLELIDTRVQNVLTSNAEWAASLDEVWGGIEGPLNKIIGAYQTATSSAQSLSRALSQTTNASYNSYLDHAPISSGGSGQQTSPVESPFAGNNFVTGLHGTYSTSSEMIAAEKAGGRMASGGVVPPGYPNDTYPALLSSGEVVLPTWFSNLLATAYQNLTGFSGLVDNSRKIQITLQGVFNEPGMVKREIMQALQQANYSAAGVNGTYYMNTGLN
jgi:hypothetical protein